MEQQGPQKASAVHKEHQEEPKGPQEDSGGLEEEHKEDAQNEHQGPHGGQSPEAERPHEPAPASSEDAEVAAARLLATEREAAELAQLALG